MNFIFFIFKIHMYFYLFQVLDVGHNQLLNVSVTDLMASQLNLLDMSLNKELKVNPREFKTVRYVGFIVI